MFGVPAFGVRGFGLRVFQFRLAGSEIDSQCSGRTVSSLEKH